MNEYSEYRRNLYTEAAMACVRDENETNIYAGSIPVADVIARFEDERVMYAADAFVVPGPSGNPSNPAGRKVIVDENVSKIVRVSDHKVHGARGANVPERQYGFLVDLATGVTGQGRGDLKITAAGTTRNGGRAYLQLSTSEIASVADMEYAAYVNLAFGLDGSLPICSVFGISVFACANMVAGAFGIKAMELGKGKRTKQTKNKSDAAHITAHTVSLGLRTVQDEIDAALVTLSETKFDSGAWSELMGIVAPTDNENQSQHSVTRNENTRETLTYMWNTDPRVAPWHGTALGAVQALNTFDLWERGTRGDTSPVVRMFDDALSQSLGERENARAEQVAMALARVS